MRTSISFLGLLVAGLTVLAACSTDSTDETSAGAGGSGASGGAGSVGASGGASSSSGGSGGSGATGGSGSCDPGQVEVFPCCGGAPPLCEPAPESGECPPGTHRAECLDGPGCELDPCTPAPPYCADEADVMCTGTSCSTVAGDCFGEMDGATLLCQCA